MAVKGYHVSLLAVAFVILRTGALDYIGCFTDSGDSRLFPVQMPQDPDGFTWRRITNDYCQRFCRTFSTNSTYFGTEDGSQCFCGNDCTRRGPNVSDSECNRGCPANSTQKCGGMDRISVYYVCNKGSFGPSCTDICHCSDGGFCYRNGSCLTGQCASGWEGATCSTDIDECSRTGYCNHNCTNTPGGYQCSCYNYSYRISSDMKTCKDIDECEEELDNCNQICVNHNGWFSCQCNSGFDSRDNGVTCTDINECEANNYGGCSHRCNNTEGSYLCQCPQDLVLGSDEKTCREPGAFQSWQKAVIGACVGGGIFIIVVVVVVCLIQRKRKQELQDNITERETEVIRHGNQRLTENAAMGTAPQMLPENHDVGIVGNDAENISDQQITSYETQNYEDKEGTIGKYEKLDISARFYDNQSAIDKQNYTTLNLH